MEIINTIQSIWTVVVFVIFIGIILWAWSGKNKAAFDDAAQLPFDKEEMKKENENG